MYYEDTRYGHGTLQPAVRGLIRSFWVLSASPYTLTLVLCIAGILDLVRLETMRRA